MTPKKPRTSDNHKIPDERPKKEPNWILRLRDRRNTEKLRVEQTLPLIPRDDSPLIEVTKDLRLCQASSDYLSECQLSRQSGLKV